MYLAIDPGGKRTGWAYFDERGRPVSDGIVDTEEDFSRLVRLLENMSPGTIIMERFQLYPWKSMALGHSQMRTSQVIGAVKLWAELKGTTVVMQPATVLTMGFRFQGLSKPTHPKDNLSAKAHGIYYLVQLGKLEAAS